MEHQRDHARPRPRLGYWPWVVLALTTLPAIWYALAFETALDPEFPRVVRQTYNPHPPAAYRFAEAGDTIDHVAVYVSAAAVVLCVWSCLRDPRRLRYAALALSMAAFWHAATPGPLLNGWHGLGWRTIFDPSVAAPQRLVLGAAAIALGLVAAWGLYPWNLGKLVQMGRDRRVFWLMGLALVLVALRQTPWVDQGPSGFWPRWIYVWGMLAWAFAILRLTPQATPGKTRRVVITVLIIAWVGLDIVGRGVFWYQRPISRLREIEPGVLYLSAMPTYRGLTLAQERIGFKTIINLFPEFTPEQSPHWPDEQRFARENGITLYNQPSTDPTGVNYIQDMLAVAQDPANQPVLVHCHASMDRSPAWVGMFRFLVNGWSVKDAIAEIERHRGSRPKSSVTLLYNRMLPILDADRAAADPTAAQLKQSAKGTLDPYYLIMQQVNADEQARAESEEETERR